MTGAPQTAACLRLFPGRLAVPALAAPGSYDPREPLLNTFAVRVVPHPGDDAPEIAVTDTFALFCAFLPKLAEFAVATRRLMRTGHRSSLGQGVGRGESSTRRGGRSGLNVCPVSMTCTCTSVLRAGNVYLTHR